MSDKALIPIEQRTIEFYEDQITAVLVEHAGEELVYVPVRPLCDFLGVDWSAQRQRIDRDEVLSELKLSVVITTTDIDPSSRRPRTSEMTCLPLDFLNGWLFGISASRVKEEVRDSLVRYQRECYRVLADAFLSPRTMVRAMEAEDQALVQLHNMALVIAATTKEMLQVRQLADENKGRLDAAREFIRGMNQRLSTVERQMRAGSLNEEQAREVQHRVNLIAKELTKRDPAVKHHQGIYEALRHETGATSYKAISPKAYEAAVGFLDQWLQAIEQSGSASEPAE